MKYSKALKLVRAARKITQKELAQKSNLDQSYISLIEQDKRVPGIDILEKLTSALEVPLYLFFFLASEKQDLKNVPEEEADRLSRNLLKLFVELPKK